MTGREGGPVDADVATVRSVLHCHPARLDADTALDRLAARLEAAEAALRAYQAAGLIHRPECSPFDARGCTCGLEEARVLHRAALRAEDAPDA